MQVRSCVQDEPGGATGGGVPGRGGEPVHLPAGGQAVPELVPGHLQQHLRQGEHQFLRRHPAPLRPRPCRTRLRPQQPQGALPHGDGRRRRHQPPSMGGTAQHRGQGGHLKCK